MGYIYRVHTKTFLLISGYDPQVWRAEWIHLSRILFTPRLLQESFDHLVTYGFCRLIILDNLDSGIVSTKSWLSVPSSSFHPHPFYPIRITVREGSLRIYLK